MGITTHRFVQVAKNMARKKGMPNARLVFVTHPVSGKTPAQHKAQIEGNNPETGAPVIQEIVNGLTKPLTEEDKKTGFLEVKTGAKLIGPQTADVLQRLFMANGWTDYLPVTLPTEQKVSDMLKGTSRRPDEVVGKMAGGDFGPWEFTVEKVAVNAVMAGAKPEYFPVILALAASGIPSLYNSSDSPARAVVINGPVREEIGMNFETGALGPFSQANAAIGRAWTLLSKNLGNAGITGETYNGSLGNSLNYNNIVIAENEANSPWQPFSLQRGFKKGESIISLFTGLGVHVHPGAKNGGSAAKLMFDRQIGLVLETFTGAGALVICDPLTAKVLKEQGYDTKEKLSEWLQKNAKTPQFASPKDISIVVTGGGVEALFQAGDLKHLASISVDEWR